MAENQRILVCAGTGCASSGAHKIIDLLQEEIIRQGIQDRVSVVRTGCHGFCEQGPTLIIEPQQTLYTQVKVEDIAEIVAQDLMEGKLVERLLYVDPLTQKPATTLPIRIFLPSRFVLF